MRSIVLLIAFQNRFELKIAFINKLVAITCVLYWICFRILAARRGIARPNLKFWIRKLCYEWCEFSQRCKTSLSKIPLDQIFMQCVCWNNFLTFSWFWKFQKSGFPRRAAIWSGFLLWPTRRLVKNSNFFNMEKIISTNTLHENLIKRNFR